MTKYLEINYIEIARHEEVQEGHMLCDGAILLDKHTQ